MINNNRQTTDSELAMLMLEWEKIQEQAKELEATIEHEVMLMGNTYTVGNVRASYYNPRNVTDYEAAAKEQGGTEQHAFDLDHYKITYDWKSYAEFLKADLDKFTEVKSPARVVVKLMK